MKTWHALRPVLATGAAGLAALTLAGAVTAPTPARAAAAATGSPVHNGTPEIGLALVHTGFAAGSMGFELHVTVTNHTGAAYQHFTPTLGVLGTGMTTQNIRFQAWSKENDLVPQPVRASTDSTVWLDSAALDTPLADGQSVTTDLSLMMPTTVAEATTSFTVASQAEGDGTAAPGSTLTVLTDGAASGTATLTPAQGGLAFGALPIGNTKSLQLQLTNSGTAPTTITSVSTPAQPFTASLPAVGTTVAPGASVQVPVTFNPAATGAQSGTVLITTSGSTVTVPLTGTGAAATPDGQALPAPTDASWTRNGSATLNGSDLVLTKAGGGYGAGSAVYPTAVPSAGLHAAFTTEIDSGSGADGLTFALLDPAAATPTSLGAPGNGLGFQGLSGVALALATDNNAQLNSANFVAVTASTSGATGNLLYTASNTAIASLRATTHAVTVDYTTAGHLVVQLDGTQVIDTAVQLPPNVVPAFTGANGGSDDNHIVRGVSITAGQSLGLTGLGVWSTTDPASSAPMDCVLWQFAGPNTATVGGQIHYQKVSTTPGSQPDPISDWSIAYTASGNYAGSAGEYSWCADTAQLPASGSGFQWVPVSVTADNGHGNTVRANAPQLAGLTITDPNGQADSPVFSTAPTGAAKTTGTATGSVAQQAAPRVWHVIGTNPTRFA